MKAHMVSTRVKVVALKRESSSSNVFFYVMNDSLSRSVVSSIELITIKHPNTINRWR